MAQIRPFRGWRYRTQQQDITTYTSQPYDVIRSDWRDMLAFRNPHNAVELELGRGVLDPSAPGNRYSTTAERWQSWKDEGIVAHDGKPAIYVIEQQFASRGIRERISIIVEAQLRRFEERVILPHERTLPKDLGDRYQLMKACKADFSPVFGLYSDPSDAYNKFVKAVKSGEPAAAATDDENVMTRMWVIDDEALIEQFVSTMADKQIFLADGHHRYTARLDLRDEIRRQRYGVSAEEAPNHPDFDPEDGSEYVMMALTNMDDPQLVLLPYHRAVNNIPNFNAGMLVAFLRKQFQIKPGNERHLEDCERPAFLFKTKSTQLQLAELKDDVNIDEAIPGDMSHAWKSLDYSVLQELVLKKIFGISYERPETLLHMDFSKSSEELIKRLDSGEDDIVFVMRAVELDQLKNISCNGEIMPQKSTFFFPKLPSGFVYRDL